MGIDLYVTQGGIDKVTEKTIKKTGSATFIFERNIAWEPAVLIDCFAPMRADFLKK